MNAQNNEPLVGHWQLQKVSYKKTIAKNSNNDWEPLLDVFKAALYDRLTSEQRSTLEDLEWLNSEAEILRDNYYQTTLEFKSNGAFYNTSQLPDKSLSGEYLLDKKTLLMDWETGDKNKFKVLNNTANELEMKDMELKITYYYNKMK